jgi:hypothetical protein
MQIQFFCEGCGTEHFAPHYLAGIRIVCPACSVVQPVPVWTIDYYRGVIDPARETRMSDSDAVTLWALVTAFVTRGAAVRQVSELLTRRLHESIDPPDPRSVVHAILQRGFVWRGNRNRRIGPIPVLLRLTMDDRRPDNENQLQARLERCWAVAFHEWRVNLDFLEEDLVIAAS